MSESLHVGPTPTRPQMTEGYGVSAEPTDRMIPWSEVRERIAQARNYWVATTRPDGRPHVMPVWGLWLDEAFYFSTDPASRKGRNLAVNPRVAVHLESGDDVVIFEGEAEPLTAGAAPAGYAGAYEAKYQFRPDVNDPNGRVYRIAPQVAFAWLEQDFLKTATRWKFARG